MSLTSYSPLLRLKPLPTLDSIDRLFFDRPDGTALSLGGGAGFNIWRWGRHLGSGFRV